MNSTNRARIAVVLTLGILVCSDVFAQRVRPRPPEPPPHLPPVTVEHPYRDATEFRGALARGEPEAARMVSEITSRARELHLDLLSDNPESAAREVSGLLDPLFIAYLQGLGRQTLAEMKMEPPPFLVTPEERARLESPESVAAARQVYSAYIRQQRQAIATAERQKHETDARDFVSGLSAVNLRDLLEFARSKGEARDDPSSLSVALIDEWFAVVQAEQSAITGVLQTRGSVPNDQLRTFDTVADTVTVPGGEHEQRYASAALRDYLASKPELARFGVEEWTFNARDAEDLWSVLRRLEDPIPGSEPEVVFFLDQAIANGSIAEMGRAWSNQGRAEARSLSHQDIDLFLSEFAGRTLLLIGHMERGDFVQERGGGQSALRMNVLKLLEAAQAKNIFLIPIGCNSAEAGAHFGFTRPILTSEVADLLQAIPTGMLSVGDLLAAFNVIGSIAVDTAGFGSFLDFTVRRPAPVNEGPAATEAVVIARLPGAPPSAYGSAPLAFSDYQQQWETENRPILDKGPLRSWRAWYRSSPVLTLLLSGALIALFGKGWDWFRLYGVRRKRLISRFEHTFIRGAISVGLLSVAAGVVRLFIEYWPTVVIVFFCLVGLVVFSWLDSSGDERKNV